ncbi:MAG TPA: 30S ribosomal protein S17 [Dehalococcoidia bacterium]|nr:30S ribosomal protein S17 [Dehalococcoidia bacterium]
MEKKGKSFVGYVVGNKMNKTVIVAVESLKSHPKYKKTIRHRVKLKAHDENNACHLGDLVRIVETRPLSKTKRWRVAEIISKEELAKVQPVETVGDDSTL